MSIKTVVVPVLGRKSDTVALDAALTIAKAQGAHVRALHVHRDPRDVLLPQVGEGMSASMLEQLVEAAQRTATEAEATSRKAFEAWRKDRSLDVAEKPASNLGVTCSFVARVGDPASVVAAEGRLADVICVVRPDEDDGADAVSVLEGAMLESGKLVYVVPPDHRAEPLRGLAIGWNGSREAARAVALAMPLIESCEKVTVLAGTSDMLTNDDVGAFVTALAWHGANASAKTFDPDEGNLAGRLQAEARNAGAQAVVLGAYSHSRLREFVFGGVTEDVMQAARMPVLIAH